MSHPLSSSDDGAIRVWKNFADLEKNPEMVTAWQGLSDMLPTTRGGSVGSEEAQSVSETHVLPHPGVQEMRFQCLLAGSPSHSRAPEILT